MPLGGREKSIPPRLMCPSQHEKRVWVSELEEGTGLCVAPFAESLLKDIFPHTQTQEGSIALCGGGIVDEVVALLCPSQHEKRVWVSELEEGTGLCVAPFAESLLKDIFPHTQTQEGSIALCGGGIVDEVKVNIKSYQYTPSSFPQH